MKRRRTRHRRVGEFIDDLGSRDFRRRDFVEMTRLVAIDHDAIRQRPQIRALAARDHQSKMIVRQLAVDAKGTSVHQTGPAEWQQRIAGIPILQ